MLHPGETAIEAHRDGSGPAHESIGSWLSAVYECHSGLVYGLVLRILGGATHAEDVVERAFLEVARTGGTALTVADAGRDVCAEACRLSIATLRA